MLYLVMTLFKVQAYFRILGVEHEATINDSVRIMLQSMDFIHIPVNLDRTVMLAPLSVASFVGPNKELWILKTIINFDVHRSLQEGNKVIAIIYEIVVD